MITYDYDYEAGKRRYNDGDIVRIKGDPDKNEADALGIVAYSGDDGSFAIIATDGYICFGERVVTEPTGKRFDLSPLYDRLRAVKDAVKEHPGGAFKVGDIVLHTLHEYSPAIVFYVFDNGDVATDGYICFGERVVTEPTGKRFDLSPLYDRLRAVKDAVKEHPGGAFKVGDIVLHTLHEYSPAIVFYVFDNGDVATLMLDGMSLGTPPQYLRATGETFDLSPMFNKIRG